MENYACKIHKHFDEEDPEKVIFITIFFVDVETDQGLGGIFLYLRYTEPDPEEPPEFTRFVDHSMTVMPCFLERMLAGKHATASLMCAVPYDTFNIPDCQFMRHMDGIFVLTTEKNTQHSNVMLSHQMKVNDSLRNAFRQVLDVYRTVDLAP